MEQLPVELAELHVCAASCRHMYAPVATFPAAAAQQRFLDIVNALLITQINLLDPGGCLMDFVLDLRGEATPESGDPGFSLADARRTRYPTMGGTAASPKHPRMAHDRT